MGVNFGKLKVLQGVAALSAKQEEDNAVTSEGVAKFDRVEDIPGWDKFGHKRPQELIDYLKTVLDKPRYAAQVLDVGQKGMVQTYLDGDQNKKISSAYGFKTIQMLGSGKDGQTYEATRYLEDPSKKYILKLLSDYAKRFNPQTKVFFEMLDKCGLKIHPMIQRNVVVKNEFMYYPLEGGPYTLASDTPEMMIRNYSKIATLNKWLIRNIGMCFWDLGFSNGRNYMCNSDNQLIWVDYGGAGIVRIPDTFHALAAHYGLNQFEEVNIPDALQKQMLVKADSNFIMSEFLLNMDFWFRQYEKDSDADVYSSIIQSRKTVCDAITNLVLPDALVSRPAKALYGRTKDKDWTNAVTWKFISKFFDTYVIK